MKQITVLEGKLIEEYYRCKRIMEACQEAAESAPKGYISHKLINGKLRHYLQWREGGKVKSKYIRDDEYLELEKRVEEGRANKATVRNMLKDMKMIEKAVGKRTIEEYKETELAK